MGLCARLFICVLKLQKWIGNHKRNLKRLRNSASIDTEQSTTFKRAKCVRGPNGYNMFCSDFFKSGMSITFQYTFIIYREALSFVPLRQS
jgi:hypothetical protein